MLCKAIAILDPFSFCISSRVICALIFILHIAYTLLIFRFASLSSLRWYSTISASIDNRLKLLYAYITFIHTTASLNMNALCYFTPYLYYSTLISLNLSYISVPSSMLTNFFCYSDFKMCLLEHLYHKDCTTTRQSWLFSTYIVINNKQGEMKLENI